MELAEITEQDVWDRLVQDLPGGHPLQLWAWGEVKRATGWTPHRLVLRRDGQPIAAGQLLFWRLPLWGQRLAYLPRGPLGLRAEAAAFLRAAAPFARAHGALCLRIEPTWTSDPPPAPWRPAPDHIQLARTSTVDLSRSEEELWAALRSKTRQYVRKAETRGVRVMPDAAGTFLPDVQRIYQATAARAGFALHTPEYYQRIHAAFGPHTRLSCAVVDGRPEAFLWVVQGGGVAIELYGGATDRGAETKANYALKWQAIVQARRDGCAVYDLNGRLHAGIEQFKGGFGGTETDYIGTYDRPLRPAQYAAWRTAWPLAKRLAQWVRRHGR